jgi:hypothetical protein
MQFVVAVVGKPRDANTAGAIHGMNARRPLLAACSAWSAKSRWSAADSSLKKEEQSWPRSTAAQVVACG